jgi:ABC-type lipoprotein export system ATPase subunit
VLANQPRLKLADESTDETDSITEREVLTLFRQIRASQPVTLVMIWPDPLVDEYSDRVLVLKDEQIVPV